MNKKTLVELAESVLKHAQAYAKSDDLKDLTKAIVRARGFMAAALKVDEDKRKK